MMARSVLNSQHSQLTNRSLYFVLGLLSAGQSLEAYMQRAAQQVTSAEPETDISPELIYLHLGLMAFSRKLSARLEAERNHVQPPVSVPVDDLAAVVRRLLD